MRDVIIEVQGDPTSMLKDKIYAGGIIESVFVHEVSDGFELAISISVKGMSMSFLEGASYVATLALARFLKSQQRNSKIFWPSTVMIGDEGFARISASCGYRDGLFLILSAKILLPYTKDTALTLAEVISFDLLAWRQDILDKKIIAGPVSGCLSEYFDYTMYLAEEVLVKDKNGRLVGAGTFGGLDVWGRAIIVDGDKKEMTYSSEQVILMPMN